MGRRICVGSSCVVGGLASRLCRKRIVSGGGYGVGVERRGVLVIQLAISAFLIQVYSGGKALPEGWVTNTCHCSFSYSRSWTFNIDRLALESFSLSSTTRLSCCIDDLLTTHTGWERQASRRALQECGQRLGMYSLSDRRIAGLRTQNK